MYKKVSLRIILRRTICDGPVSINTDDTFLNIVKVVSMSESGFTYLLMSVHNKK